MTMFDSVRWLRCLVLVSLMGVSIADRLAVADFVGIGTAAGYVWDRPTAAGGSATFQAWEAFSSVVGPNPAQTVFGADTGDPTTVTTGAANGLLGFGGPAAATWPLVNSAGEPNVFDTSTPGSSFLTSGGNIYSPTGIVAPRILIPNNIDGITGNQLTGGTFLTLQVRTQGSLADLNSFKLTDAVSGTLVNPFNVDVLATQVLGGFGGTLQDVLVDFYVAGNSDLYEINFVAGSSSMSLDRVAVDTYFSATGVPEPSSWALLGVASIGGLRRRIRRA